MTRIEAYRQILRELTDWEPYLLAESRLPGPRGNLELAQAVADVGSPELFWRLVTWDAGRAPTNTPGEFLAFCGVLGMGRLLVQGDPAALATLRSHASDPRWRTREAVAMALQRLGTHDMERLFEVVEAWLDGNWLEQRAVVAALCEPALLTVPQHATRALAVLDRVTANLSRAADRRDPALRTLRQALGYGWSVAIVARPEVGWPLFEKWAASTDPDVQWIVRENRKKRRLRAAGNGQQPAASDNRRRCAGDTPGSTTDHARASSGARARR